METPGNFDLDHLQKYIASVEMGPFALCGQDSDIWGDIIQRKNYAPDIITLLPRKREGMFFRSIIEYGLAKWFQLGLDRFLKPSPAAGIVGYETSTLLRLSYLTTTVIASVIPILSIVVLYFIQSTPARLGVIGGFTVLISVSMVNFTSAKRSDILIATAVFTVIQIIFIHRDSSARA